MKSASHHCHHLVQARRHDGLRVVTVPPCGESSVAFEGNDIVPARGYGDHVAEPQWNSNLSGGNFMPQPPSHNRPVALDGQSMTRRSGNSRYIGQIHGYVALTIIIVTPRDYRPVLLQRQSVRITGRNSYHVAQARWHDGPIVGCSPDQQCSITLECNAVCHACDHFDHVAQTRWHGALSVIICAPRHHRSFASHSKTVIPSGGNLREGQASPAQGKYDFISQSGQIAARHPLGG